MTAEQDNATNMLLLVICVKAEMPVDAYDGNFGNNLIN